jgi:hypothetical protein
MIPNPRPPSIWVITMAFFAIAGTALGLMLACDVAEGQTISSDTTYQDQTLVFSEDLEVTSGAKLAFKGCDVTFRPPGTVPLYLRVQSGSLLISDTDLVGEGAGFIVDARGPMDIRNVTTSGLGGVANSGLSSQGLPLVAHGGFMARSTKVTINNLDIRGAPATGLYVEDCDLDAFSLHVRDACSAYTTAGQCAAVAIVYIGDPSSGGTARTAELNSSKVIASSNVGVLVAVAGTTYTPTVKLMGTEISSSASDGLAVHEVYGHGLLTVLGSTSEIHHSAGNAMVWVRSNTQDQSRMDFAKGRIYDNVGTGLSVVATSSKGIADLTLDDCTIESSGGHGVAVTANGCNQTLNVTLKGSKVKDAGGAGFYFTTDMDGQTSHYHMALLDALLDSSGSYGVYVKVYQAYARFNLTLDGTQVVRSGKTGVYLDYHLSYFSYLAAPAAISNLTIKDSRISDNRGYGIYDTRYLRTYYLWAQTRSSLTAEVTVLDSTLANNTASAMVITTPSQLSYPVYSSRVYVGGSTFINNSGHGVYERVDSNTPTNGGSTGLGWHIWDSTFTDLSGSGVYVELRRADNAGLDLFVHGCTFSDLGGNGVALTTTSSPNQGKLRAVLADCTFRNLGARAYHLWPGRAGGQGGDQRVSILGCQAHNTTGMYVSLDGYNSPDNYGLAIQNVTVTRTRGNAIDVLVHPYQSGEMTTRLYDIYLKDTNGTAFTIKYTSDRGSPLWGDLAADNITLQDQVGGMALYEHTGLMSNLSIQGSTDYDLHKIDQRVPPDETGILELHSAAMDRRKVAVFGSGSLWVFNDLTVKVEWQNGLAALGAGVQVLDRTFSVVGVGRVDSEAGMEPLELLGYIMDATEFRSRSPFIINITFLDLEQTAVCSLDEPAVVRIVIHDRVAPSLVILEPDDGSAQRASQFELRGSAFDAHAGLLEIRFRLDGGNWTAIGAESPFRKTVEDVDPGHHLLEVEVGDRAGNVAMELVRIEIDNQPPRLVIVSPQANVLTRDLMLTVRGETEDGAHVTINGEDVTSLHGLFIHQVRLEEGPNTVTVVSMDRLSNVATVRFTAVLDTVEPFVDVQSHGDGDWVSVSDLVLEGIIEANCTLTIDRTPVEVVEGNFSTLLHLSPGENVVLVKAVDPAGNVYSTTLVIMVATEPPWIHLEAPEQDAHYDHRTVRVLGTVQEGSTLTINGKPITLKQGLIDELVALPEGASTITVEALDPAGNLNTVTRTVVVDTVPPVLTLDPAPATTRDDVVLITGTAEGASRLWLDGEPVDLGEGGAFAVNVTLTEGTNVLRFTARDPVGHETLASSTVELDTTAPFVRVLLPPMDGDVNGTLYYDRDVLVVRVVSEAGAKVTVNGIFVILDEEGTATVELRLDGGGVGNDLVVRSEDEVGNVEELRYEIVRRASSSSGSDPDWAVLAPTIFNIAILVAIVLQGPKHGAASRPKGRDLMRRAGLVALLALLSLATLAGLASAGLSGTPPPAGEGGDWIVSVDTIAEGEFIALAGDVRVLADHELVIKDCTVTFQGAWEHNLLVEPGARLLIDGATLTAAPAAARFTFEVHGSARLVDSDISRMRGGVQALSDGLVVEGCHLHRSDGAAIELHGHDATVRGCTIEYVDVGVSSIVIDGEDSIATTDGWSFTLADTTLSAKSYGVYLYWKKTLSGTLDLDFITSLTNVDISRSTNAGIYCYVDLYVNKGSGTLDSLFDLKMTGGSSNLNGGPGLYVYHYLKPYYLNGRVTAESRIALQSASFNSNKDHGIHVEDTLYQDRGSAPSITHRQSLSLTDCKVSSNTKDGIYVSRPRTIYYVYSTGGKARTSSITLTNTEVRSNGCNGLYVYDNHYAYSTRGKFTWTNTIKLDGAKVIGNGMDGIYSQLYERLYYGDRSGVDYRQTFDFQDSEVAGNNKNGFYITTSGYMYYHGTMSFRNDLNVLRCRVHNNTELGGYAYFYVYGYDWQYTFHRRGSYTIEENLVEDNDGGGIYARTYGYSYKQTCDVPLRCLNNVVRDNGADRALGFEGMSGNTGEALATGNLFEGNGGAGGSSALDLVYFSQFVVYDNTFRNDTHRAMVRCYAYSMAGPSPNVGPKYNHWVQVYENTFEDCGAGTGQSEGAVYLDNPSGKGSILVRDNVMLRCEGNGVATYRARGTGTLYIQYNVFEAIGGSGVSLASSYSGAKTQVAFNYMGNGTGSSQSAAVLVKEDGGSTVTVEDNVAELCNCSGVISTGGKGPGTLTVRRNRFVGLRGNAIDLVGNRFTVEGNNLSDCKGFAIALRGFTSLPTVGENDLSNAENGLLLEAQELSDGRRLKVFMDNITWEVNETAIYTNHLDLVITNSTLSGRKALHANDGVITTISTKVPYLSGGTGNEGLIEVFYNLGLQLTWANATGHDSGLPAGDALVVFKKDAGGYYTSRIVDARGHLEPELFVSWRINEGHVDRISPFNLEITASGLVTQARLKVDKDQVAEVKVVDWSLPSISIEKPYHGARVNTADLTVKGFLSELGSGLDGAWASSDGEHWEEVEPQQIWEAYFEDLGHGSAKMYAKARDRSGNVNVTWVEFELDLLGPDLEILRPLNRTRTQDAEIIIEAKTEETAELFLDGIPVINRQGQLFERYMLTQGLNILVVEAVDHSGNAAIEVLHVWLDTVAPALFVSEPKEGEVMGTALIPVSGRTERGADVTVNDQKATVDEEGWFYISYLLTSRENLLAIEARDMAGNVNVTYRRVTLDDQPPEFTVIRPLDGALTSATQIEVEGSVGQDDLDAVIYVAGERVEHQGRFTWTVVLEEGENRIEVLAVDPNGRMSTSIIRVVRDTVPPTLVLVAPPSATWTTREGEVRIAGSAETATALYLNVHGVELTADGAFDFMHQLDAGPNAMELIAVDEAGNEDIILLTITWDYSPPELTLDQLPERTDQETIMLNGTTDGVTVRVNGVPVPVELSAFSVPLHLTMGRNAFDVDAEDEAGNVASYHIVIERESGSADKKVRGLSVDFIALAPMIAAIIALIATGYVLRGRPPASGARPAGGRPPGRREGDGQGPGPAHPEDVVVELPSEPVSVDIPEPPAPEVTEPEEPEVSLPELELEFEAPPVYSVPDPSQVDGVVDVDAKGDFRPPVVDVPVSPQSVVEPPEMVAIEPEEPAYAFESPPTYSVPDPRVGGGVVDVQANGEISSPEEGDDPSEEPEGPTRPWEAEDREPVTQEEEVSMPEQQEPQRSEEAPRPVPSRKFEPAPEKAAPRPMKAPVPVQVNNLPKREVGTEAPLVGGIAGEDLHTTVISRTPRDVEDDPPAPRSSVDVEPSIKDGEPVPSSRDVKAYTIPTVEKEPPKWEQRAELADPEPEVESPPEDERKEEPKAIRPAIRTSPPPEAGRPEPRTDLQSAKDTYNPHFRSKLFDNGGSSKAIETKEEVTREEPRDDGPEPEESVSERDQPKDVKKEGGVDLEELLDELELLNGD